jgi:hypothetical protein
VPLKKYFLYNASSRSIKYFPYRIQQIFYFSSGNLNVHLNTTYYLHLLLIKTVLVMDKVQYSPREVKQQLINKFGDIIRET